MLTGKSTATTFIAMRLRRNMSVTVKNSWTSLRYASYKKSSKDMTNFWRLTIFFMLGQWMEDYVVIKLPPLVVSVYI